MKVLMAAMAIMIGFTACNREAKREGDEAARQAGDDVREGGGQLTDKAAEEARQTTRDIGEGADAATGKVREEARQTSRDVKEAMAMDDAKTDADKQIISRIRTALRADKVAAAESRDVRIIAKDGKVTLEGTVASQEAKDGIARVSRKIAGATRVDDEVKVAERVGAGSSDR